MRWFFVIILTSSFLLIFGVFFLWQGIYLPKDLVFLKTKNKLFSIEKGQNLFQIGKNLEEEGLIKNRFFFDIYVIIKGKEKRLQAGKYLFNSSMSSAEIAKKIISGETFKIKVTIPEGFNLKQIKSTLEKFFPGSDPGKYSVKDFKLEFDFLKDIPGNASLEGFLFPDTYFFNLNESEKEVLQKFLKNFDQKLNLDLREEIKKQDKTIFEIVTMASLIEKEVYNTKECKDCKELVSGILWKRLKNNIPLQVDATITYITGKKTTKISKEEIQIDHPYNTYKYLGLPPGPISNSGLESIIAALYPKNSEYWYYLSTSEGETIFSRTLEEHNIAKAKYLK